MKLGHETSPYVGTSNIFRLWSSSSIEPPTPSPESDMVVIWVQRYCKPSPRKITIDGWDVNHSQSWLVYGIVMSTEILETSKGIETQADLTSGPMRTHVDPAHPTRFERGSWPTQHHPDVCVAWQESVLGGKMSTL